MPPIQNWEFVKPFGEQLNHFFHRPKCDPVKHFGLEMTQDKRGGQCFKITRKWFAIQIIPIGFSAIFNTGKY